MFGRDPVSPLNILLGPKMRYLGNDMNILLVEAMKNMFEIAATNLKMAQERGDPKSNPIPNKLQPGDTVLFQNHTKGPFDPKYVGDYCVVSPKGEPGQNSAVNRRTYRDETYIACKVHTSCRLIYKTNTRLFCF